MQNENKNKPDWEKLGNYIVIVGSLATLFFYIADMKERTTKLESDYGHETRFKAIEKKLGIEHQEAKWDLQLH